MKNQLLTDPHSPTCSGNAIVFVLIVIGLIAALTMAITRSSQQSSSTTTLQADVAAQSILRQANTLASNVQNLMQRGCSESQISFENLTEAGYINAGAPSNFSCHLFRSEGTGLNWPLFPENMGATTNVWTFSAGNQVFEVGSDCAQPRCNELIVMAEILPAFQAVCEQINFRLGINASPIPSRTSLNTTKFVGSFGSAAPVIGDVGTTTVFAGRNSGCFLNTTTNNYTFYNVLIAR